MDRIIVREIVILITMLLVLLIMAYSIVLPQAAFYITYANNESDTARLTDDDVRLEFMDCLEQPGGMQISEYDERRDCYWGPFKDRISAGCFEGICIQYPLPHRATKVLVYSYSMDEVFISNIISVKDGTNYYGVVLRSSDALIFKKTESEVERFRDASLVGFDNDYIKPSPLQGPEDERYIFALIIAVLWIVYWRWAKKQ